ncbi:MAG: hypothetical protein HRU20_01525 [Pseudomonadales bacterium]|nr:hypothetical protein [Pseudomonadales bacterium]
MKSKNAATLLILAFAISACIDSSNSEDASMAAESPEDVQLSAVQLPAVQALKKDETLLFDENSVTTDKHKILAIDHESRKIRLMDEAAVTFTLVADKEAHQFEQLEVGDMIYVDHVLSYSITLSKDITLTNDNSLTVDTYISEPGEEAGMEVFETSTLILTVEAVDYQAGSFKLKNPDAKVIEYVAKDPEILAEVKAGDAVIFTLTQGIMLSLKKAG